VHEIAKSKSSQKIESSFSLPQPVPSLSAACLMPVAQRSLAALLSCAPDTLYVACVWLVHGAVVPRGSLSVETMRNAI